MLFNNVSQQAIDHAPEDAQERAVYYCNAAACYLKQQAWQLAVEQCTQALKLNNSYLKVLYMHTALESSPHLHNKVTMQDVLMLQLNCTPADGSHETSLKQTAACLVFTAPLTAVVCCMFMTHLLLPALLWLCL
jgi:hypothetical protein